MVTPVTSRVKVFTKTSQLWKRGSKGNGVQECLLINVSNRRARYQTSKKIDNSNISNKLINIMYAYICVISFTINLGDKKSRGGGQKLLDYLN